MTIDIPQSDALLVGETVDGELEAFAVLYDRHYSAIYDFLARLLRDVDDAADATQDTFVRALERLPQLENPERFRGWLFSIAYRIGLNRIAQRKRSSTVEPAKIEEAHEDLVRIDPSRLDDPERAAEAQETAALVWNLARGLDDRSYTVLDLHVRQGLPSVEIAQVLGVSKGNAYTLVSRMKKRMEDSIGTYLLARKGSKDCEKLAALLEGVEIPPVTPEISRMINHHVKNCEICQSTRRGLLLPTAVIGALSAVPMQMDVMSQGRLDLLTGPPPSWFPSTAAQSESKAAGPTRLGAFLSSNAAIIALVLLLGGGAALAMWFGGSNNGSDTTPTVLGVQITAPTTAGSTDGASGGGAPTATTAPVSGGATTTTTPTAGGVPSTTVPPTSNSSTTTTAPSSSTTTTVPTTGSTTSTTVAGGATTTSTTTTTTVPANSTTTTTTTTIPPAADPGDVSTTSHLIGVATTNNVVTVVWTPVSGALGYSVSWSPGAPALPDQIVDLPGGASQAVSPPLAAGNWFFNLRTQGPGGDWTSTEHLGPFVIVEPSPPEVTHATASPQSIVELSPSGGACSQGPSTSTVAATVGDPDADIVSVRLDWAIDAARRGTATMIPSSKVGVWTVGLSFDAATLGPNEKSVDVDMVVTATDSAGLTGSLDGGPVTLSNCFEVAPSPPAFVSIGANPPDIYELSPTGGACLQDLPSTSTVTAVIVDPDNDIMSVRLDWTIDADRSGTAGMTPGIKVGGWTGGLSFSAATLGSNEKTVAVAIVATATDSAGLTASSLDVGPVFLSLNNCFEQSVEIGRGGRALSSF